MSTLLHAGFATFACMGACAALISCALLALCPSWCLWWPRVQLERIEVEPLLAMARPSFPSLMQSSVYPGLRGVVQPDFTFVFDVLLAFLMSMYPAAEDLHRLLRLDWVREWAGWREAAAVLDQSMDDAQLEAAAGDYVQRFSRLVLQNSDVPGRSDRLRKSELVEQGKIIGVGLVHGNNECCADSLLQGMARQGFVPVEVGGNGREALCARREACVACRAFLIHHEDRRLHPRRRTAFGAIADASDYEHDSSFLQHDVHAEAIMRFFLRHFRIPCTCRAEESGVGPA